MPNHNKIKTAFTLIEISLVIIVIGILIAAIANGTSLMSDMRLAAARSLSKGSPVSSIPDLMLWYDATSEESFKKEESRNDLFISQWNDINPTTTSKFDLSQLDQTRKPQYKKSGINNLPAIYFDSTKYLARSDVDVITSKGSATIFIVYYGKNFGYGQEYMINQPILNCSNNIEIGANLNPGSYRNFGIHAGCRYSTMSANETIKKDKATIATLLMLPTPLNSGTSNNIKVYLNGISQIMQIYNNGYNGNLSGSYAKGITYLYMGIRNEPAINKPDAGFNGLIGEVIIFQRDLDDYEIDSVHKYLSQKWGIKLKWD